MVSSSAAHGVSNPFAIVNLLKAFETLAKTLQKQEAQKMNFSLLICLSKICLSLFLAIFLRNTIGPNNS